MDRIAPTSHHLALRTPGGHELIPAAATNHLDRPRPPLRPLKAIRRKFWPALAFATLLVIASSIVVVRLPDEYTASAEIKITPPQYNPVVAAMFGADARLREANVNSTYIPSLLAGLRGKAIAAKIAEDPAFSASVSEIYAELGTNLVSRQVQNTNVVLLSLDGRNPARIAKLLNAVVKVIQERAREEIDEQNQEAQRHAKKGVETLSNELKGIDELIRTEIAETHNIGPNGQSLIAQQYLDTKALLIQEINNLNQTKYHVLLLQNHIGSEGAGSALDSRMGQLAVLKKKYRSMLSNYLKISRDQSDPAVQHSADRLSEVLEEMDQLRKLKQSEPRAADIMLQNSEQKVADLDARCRELLVELQKSMPAYQKYQTLVHNYEDATKRLSSFKIQNANFELLAQTQKEPIVLLSQAIEPTAPTRPKRPLLIAIATLVSCLLGIGLAMLLESFDHRVKAPEQVTVEMGLPLLGVIPRARRVSELVRGGHIWTAAAPQSVEADAYRNVRAGLLGIEHAQAPAVIILVTSAKAGEGKSTTALNLAATCARAGERTLLVDCDLRRPSLREVFADAETPQTGVIDVVKGLLPWQRTVVRSEIPNLDFLPTGDTSEAPIEVLGTLEMRQLFRALAMHYDRVIIDGPAILGMADCRMLGMYCDTSILVVRAGAHDPGPLARAKTVLEQSRINIAGAVFNGLSEDLGGWSSVSGLRGYSYGYGYVRPAPGRPALEAATSPADRDEQLVDLNAG